MQHKTQIKTAKQRIATRFRVIIAVCATIFAPLVSYDLPHFYHATLIPYSVIEPILDRDELYSAELFLATGVGTKGENSQRQTVPTFDIFGISDAKHMVDGISHASSNNQLDYLLIQLQALPDTNDRFSKLSISGKVFPSQYDLFFTKVFNHGIFIQAHIPVRSCEVMSIETTDLSPTAKNIFPNKDNYEWYSFLRQFDEIMKRYSISLKSFDKTVLGNPTILFGITHSYVHTTFLDFIDVTAGTGITFNATSRSGLKQVLAAPFFDRSFTGIPLQVRAAIGAYDWLTLGIYGEATLFFDGHQKRHVTTSDKQQGMIHLAVTDVKVKKGPNVHVCGYIKADHVVRGLSLLFGYSYVFSAKETVHAVNKTLFPYDAINKNKQLKSWDMHTLHYIFAYDFSLQHSWYGPRVSIGYNQIVSGKRIIKSNMLSGEFGIEWLF